MAMVVSNIFHCCVQKTASQWIRAILSDEMVLARTSMRMYSYQRELPGKIDMRRLHERKFFSPFPPRTIASPLYLEFQSYHSIPKPNSYKTFFVQRDPRDIVVSWYYSVRYSHKPIGRIPEHRIKLSGMNMTDGLIYSIAYLKDYGIFLALESWLNKTAMDPHIKIVSYEEITNHDRQENQFGELFSHCEIDLSKEEIESLLSKYCFANMRSAAEHSPVSHYRKGQAGNWAIHFTKPVSDFFSQVTGDLLSRLGY
jgi:hypothetical protein